MTSRIALIPLLLLGAIASVTTARETDGRPNIVFILADDMGIDATSLNNPEGMGPIKTPHIDRLATQGMNFTDAHSASAVCTPTRYGLLTGRYCWRTELKKEVLWDYGRPLIEKERLTVAELLKKEGYTTGIIGKWHLGFDWYDADGKPANADLEIEDAIWKPGERGQRIRDCEARIDFSRPLTGGPLDHGFDHYFGVDLPNMPPYAWIDGDRLTAMPTVPKPKEMFGTEGPMVPGWKLEEILPTLAERSASWIKEQAAKEGPFFLYLSLTSPHTPIVPSAPFQGVSGATPYADFLIETDAVVGTVVEALATAGIADDTLLIFTADNGTAAASNFGKLKKHGIDLKRNFKGNKGQLADGGHRVPFVVRWPGTVPAKSTCTALVGLNDFMATVADILEVPLPDDAAEDSVSILSLMTGSSKNLKDRPMVVHHDYRGRFAIRESRWKLVGAELFDMQADPKETTDVASKHPEVLARMQSTLERYQTEDRSRDLKD